MPKKLVIPAAVFALLMIGLLSAQVILIESQRELITRQTRVAEAQRLTALGVLADGRDLAEQIDLGGIRREGRRAADLVRETRPLVDELNAVDAAQALAATGKLAAELLEGGRIVELSDRTIELMRELDSADAVSETLRLQREILATQREALGVLRRSLSVQSEALTHVRSIDRKTGGPVPPAGG